MMNSFIDLIQNHIDLPQPNYTPAEIPHVDRLKNGFTSAVQSGLAPEKVFKMTSIMVLLSQRGITTDDFRNHNLLFIQLCLDSDFSIMDHNINDIFNQMNLARNS